MNDFAVSMMLLGVALTLILSAIAVFALRTPLTSAAGPQPWTRFFLVALRLSIGWHFFVEGMDKLNSASWSSEPYLREATGPLAPFYRELAGDRLIDKLTLGEGGAFPAALEADWRAYLDSFTAFYDLDPQEAQQARLVRNLAEARTKHWLDAATKSVQKPSEYPPPLMVELTVPQRLEEYHKLEAKLRQIEAERIPRYGSEAFAELKTAKANLNKWRGELKSDLDKQTLDFKKALRDEVLLPIATKALPPEDQAKVSLKESAKATAKGKAKGTRADPIPLLRTMYHQLLLRQGNNAVKLSPQASKVFQYAIDTQKGTRDFVDPLPSSQLRHAARPMASWKLLDWSDTLVKWGILVVGILLLLGFLTRTACVVGALLLLMFFLAMPPLPGWPESPRAEGHYLFINKNIIEMFALLTLATTRSGRWVGIDSLLQFLCPRRWRNGAKSDNLNKPVSLGEAPTIALNEGRGARGEG